MYTNRPGCTIYEKTVRNRAPTYIRHETKDIFWEDTKSQESGSNRTPKNGAFVAIPISSIDYEPKTDDRIVGSIIEDEQPPSTAMTIMSVQDFRYGSPRNQHWEVLAE